MRTKECDVDSPRLEDGMMLNIDAPILADLQQLGSGLSIAIAVAADVFILPLTAGGAVSAYRQFEQGVAAAPSHRCET